MKTYLRLALGLLLTTVGLAAEPADQQLQLSFPARLSLRYECHLSRANTDYTICQYQLLQNGNRPMTGYVVEKYGDWRDELARSINDDIQWRCLDGRFDFEAFREGVLGDRTGFIIESLVHEGVCEKDQAAATELGPSLTPRPAGSTF